MGVTENRCRITPEPVNKVWIVDENNHRLCGGGYTCPENLYCGNPINYGLPMQESLEEIHELNYGYTKFDNILDAIITI